MLRQVLLLALASQLTASASVPGSHPLASRADGDDSKQKVWQPRAGTKFQMILTGVPDIDAKNASVTPDVPVYDIDLFDTPAETIAALKKLGKKVVCYFSAGTAEDWRPDFKDFPGDVKGAKLPLWPGEVWLDIRNAKVLEVQKKRIKLAGEKKCDAIDPDNMDGYSNQAGGGFKKPLNESDSVAYVRQLSREAHRLGMSMGLKNAAEILPKVKGDVEFAVSEECALDDSCDVYSDFTMPGAAKGGRKPQPQQAGKAVFHLEYVNHTGAGNALQLTNRALPKLKDAALRQKLCLQDAGSKKVAAKTNLSTVIKELIVRGWMLQCDGQIQETKIYEPVHTNATRPGRRDVEQEDVTPGADVTDVADASASDMVEVTVYPESADAEIPAQVAAEMVDYVPSLRKGAMKDRRPAPPERFSKEVQ